MILIPLFQIVIFIGFLLYVVKQYGVQPSISDSWYVLKDHNKEYLFTFFIWALSIPILFLSHISGFYFASAAFLSVVGVATMFKEDHVERVHVIGALGGIFFALLALLLEGIWLPLVGTSLISLYLRYKKISNLTWWVEIVAFACIELGLLYKFIVG